jgi:hypothetical protein
MTGLELVTTFVKTFPGSTPPPRAVGSAAGQFVISSVNEFTGMLAVATTVTTVCATHVTLPFALMVEIAAPPAQVPVTRL